MKVLAPVTAVRKAAHREYREIVLAAPGIAAEVRPGQFVNVRLPRGEGPLLRRPFSVADRDAGTIVLLMRVKGRFTREAARLRPGDELDVLGPLGNGFTPRQPGGTAFLAAGGCGIAALFMLAKSLQGAGTRVVLACGAKTADEMLWKERIEEAGLSACWATEDGTAGEKGTVVDLAAKLIPSSPQPVYAYACGPVAMLRALHERFPGVSTQVALEAMMACGTGLCHGCSVPVKDGTGYERYARACKDGPVFDAGTVDWEAMPAP